MILLCLLLVCWAKPARGPFSSVFAIPGGGFFLSLLGSSMRLRNPRAFLQPHGSVSVRPHGLITGGVSRSQRGLLLGGQHRWNAHPCAQGAGESSGLVFAYLSASVLFQLFGDHSGDTVSASPGQVSHLQITTSEHLSYETSLEAALSTLITAVLTTLLAVYPFRLLMWLLPAYPLYCLGKRAGTSAADRWDSHRMIPRWPKQLCFPGVGKVMTKSITAREACS